MKTILRLATGALLTLELFAVGATGEETIQMRGVRMAHFRALGEAEEQQRASALALAFAAPDEWAAYAKAQPAFLMEQMARAHPDLLTDSDTHRAAAHSAMAAVLAAAPYKASEYSAAMLVAWNSMEPLPQITEAPDKWMAYLAVLRIERNLRLLLKATASDEWAVYEAAKSGNLQELATAERAYESAMLTLVSAAPDEWAAHAEVGAILFVVSLLGSDTDEKTVLEAGLPAFLALKKAAPAAKWTAFFEAKKAYNTVAYNTAHEAYSATADDWRLYLRALDRERGFRILLKATDPDDWAAYEAGRKWAAFVAGRKGKK